MKIYSNNIRDQFYDDRFIAVDLVEIQLKNTDSTNACIYLSNGNFDIFADTPTAPNSGINLYTGQGEFIGFSHIPEELDVKVGKFSISISCIGNNYINLFTTTDFEGRRVCIYKAFLDYNTLAIVDSTPILIYDGIIMNASINETSATCDVNIDCSSLFSDYERTNGRHTNNGSNQWYQGNTYDTSMSKAGFTGNTQYLWGRTTA
jgi:hypothetical protein